MKFNTIKSLTFLFVTVAFLIPANAQYLCVQSAAGITANSGKLEVGTDLVPDALLAFSSKTDKALFMDTKGTLWLASAESLPGDSILQASLSTVLQAYKGYETRGFRKTEDRILDLKTYFGSGKFTVIGSSLEVLLDAKNYPLNNDRFVVFYYKIGEKQVSKKVGFNNQKLIIEKDKLFTSGNAVNQTTELRNLVIYTHRISKKETEAITKIHLGFVEKETLKQELNTIKKWATDHGITEVEKCVTAFFSAVYGRCDVKQWNDVMLN